MSGAKGFDLAAVLGDVSRLDTGREQIEYINIDLLDSDDRNFYQLTDLEQLAANIELIGLQQPLRIRPHPEQEGRFVIVSGHRRRAALALLAGEGKDRFRDVPCIRESSAASAALQELRLIYANSDTRKMSSSEVSQQVERVEMLLYQLKEEGVKFPGRMRDHVAEACKVSQSKLARLKVIREGLQADFAALYSKNKLSESVAYELARLPEGFQTRLFRIVSPKDLNAASLSRVGEAFRNGDRWESSLCCPNGKTCTHADAALRHDLVDPWCMCKATKCCLECSYAKDHYGACERACSKAKAARSEALAAEKAKTDAELRRKTNRHQQKTQANALRLLPLVEAAGLKDTAQLEWERYSSCSVGSLRKYAAGDFDDSETWYCERFSPDSIYDAKKISLTLHCTTDFLFGLTETPQASSIQQTIVWFPGSTPPQDPCDVVADFVLAPGQTLRKICRFDGHDFRFSSGDVIELEPIRWLKLPPEKPN